MAKSKPPREDLIDWFTITYRSIYIVVGVLMAVAAGAGYYYWTKNAPPKVATTQDPSTKRRKVAWHISAGEVNFETVRRNVEGSSTEVSTPTVKATAGEL